MLRVKKYQTKTTPTTMQDMGLFHFIHPGDGRIVATSACVYPNWQQYHQNPIIHHSFRGQLWMHYKLMCIFSSFPPITSLNKHKTINIQKRSQIIFHIKNLQEHEKVASDLLFAQQS